MFSATLKTMEKTEVKTILVVDDEEEVTSALANTLKRVGYEVLTATTGRDALSKAKKHTPDLVILDIVMPGMDGGDVAAALAEDPVTADTPIIFLTALLAKAEETHIKTSGKHYILGKPVVGKELIALVNQILAC